MKTKTSTVDAAEVEQFSRIAGEWWDPHGKFKPLHDIGPVRIGWILQQITVRSSQFAVKNLDLPTANCQPHTLKGLRLLDIGCGGGLIAEPMARLGATVTAIDASQKNIAVAKLHAEKSGLMIDYRCMAAEDLAATGAQFDIVLALEIVEHVADVELFVSSCATLVKPGGLLIMSTLNRTLKSYALAIIGAEYILRWLPRGTHDWHKFLKPSELYRAMQKNNIEVTEMTGMTFNPLTRQWRLEPRNLEVNYLMCGRRNPATGAAQASP